MNFFLFFFIPLLLFAPALCIYAGLKSPRRPAVQFHLQRASLSLSAEFLFSHVDSHTYRFVHFSSRQDWHLVLLRNTYQMRDVTGADEEKEEDESPIYHISIPSQWIIEKRSRLTRVARPRVCWLFFARPSLFAMLHNLFAPLPAWHQPVHLFVCLPPGARPLLPHTQPPLKRGLLGCRNSHVTSACCTGQARCTEGCVHLHPVTARRHRRKPVQLWQGSGACHRPRNRLVHALRTQARGHDGEEVAHCLAQDELLRVNDLGNVFTD